MALREFTDGFGVQWQVWDIAPEWLQARMRAEPDARGLREGWLVFEAVDGSEKRRASPVPRGWQVASDAELERMLRAAKPVRARRGAPELEEHGSPPAVAELQPSPMRTFLYPGGRLWTVSEVLERRGDEGSEEVDVRPLLRFTAGARTLDLLAWPKEWTQYSDAQLSDLLWRAFPRRRGAPNPTGYRRRRGD